jgi:hypothetical protein
MTRLALTALAVSLPLVGAAQPRPPDLERGLVAAFALDGDALNAVTRTRAAALATRPTDDRDGVRGGALWFDGVRAGVNAGASLQPARFTLAAWIRPEAVDRVQVIVSKIRNLPGHYQKNLELRLDPGGRLFLHVPSGQGWEGAQGARPIPPGRWTHVAAVYDGTRAQLFVDGVPDGAPLAVRYAQSPTETWIGARPEAGGADGRTPAGPTWSFFGALDDVRIWERPLADAEIALVAGRGRAPAPATPPYAEPVRPPPPRGPAAAVAVYPLDGDAREALGGSEGALAGAKAAADRAGNPAGALAFGGKAHVDLGTRAAPGRFSLSLWVRPARAAREQVIFSKVSSPPGVRERWLELGLDSLGRAVLSLPSAGQARVFARSTQRLASGRWSHLAATWDGERAALYLDGAPAGAALLEPFAESAGPTFLGARPDATGRRARLAPLFDGQLDDVRIFRGALGEDEVALLARTEERPRPPPGRDDEDGDDLLLVRVGKLLVRYDAACARRDPDRIAKVEERIARELEEATRAARGDRELVARLREVTRELERERGQHDAVSLDRKRSALASLASALWDDLARELDAGSLRPASGAAPPPPGGW